MRPSRLLAAALLASAWAALGACSSDDGGAATSGSGGSGATTTASSATSSTTTSSAVASVSASSGGALPDTFTVSGVVTDGNAPVAGAIVMQAGGVAPMTTTGADGSYTIDVTTAIPGTPTVVAAKEGYRTAGVEFLALPDGPVELALRAVLPPDNEAYVYGDPGTGDPAHDTSTLQCGHCHTTFAKQFQTSAHAKATKDPLVQDLYAGVSEAYADAAACASAGGAWKKGLVPGTASDTKEKCYLGGGVLADLNPACAASAASCDDPAQPSPPSAFGHCADCHAPGIDGKAGGRSLHEATGLAYEYGNHCDVCHHARDVDLAKPPGVAGALVLQRPHEKVSDEPGAKVVQAIFGPLPDVPNQFMGGTLAPVFGTSKLCAGCHEQKQEALVPGTSLDAARWPDGLPTHSTYSEWAASAYSPSTTCEFCHMPPDDTGLASTVDVTNATNASITFGFLRPPQQIRKHIFRDPLEGKPRLIDTAVTLALALTAEGADLHASVQVANVLAGHAIPTGEPMRAALLVVRGVACGAALEATGGLTLDDVGGASATATLGAGATLAGTTLDWSEGASRAKPGDVVRFVRPSGAFADYPGVGFFADPALTPAEKGLSIDSPVGEATVVSVSATSLTLSVPVAAQPGDRAYLGDALGKDPVDGAASLALAGSPGVAFARVLVDANGARLVPHYRAVDMVRDNRLVPGSPTVTTHVFAIPPGCPSATVTASLVYRPVPVGQARQRGWDARDWVVASTTKTIAL